MSNFIVAVTKAGLIGFIKSNFGMLWEVADSLWMLLRTNLTLLLSAVGTLVSAILGGGHAVLKFLFHTVMERFFCALSWFVDHYYSFFVLDHFLYNTVLLTAKQSRSLFTDSNHH